MPVQFPTLRPGSVIRALALLCAFINLLEGLLFSFMVFIATRADDDLLQALLMIGFSSGFPFLALAGILLFSWRWQWGVSLMFAGSGACLFGCFLLFFDPLTINLLVLVPIFLIGGPASLVFCYALWLTVNNLQKAPSSAPGNIPGLRFLTGPLISPLRLPKMKIAYYLSLAGGWVTLLQTIYIWLDGFSDKGLPPDNFPLHFPLFLLAIFGLFPILSIVGTIISAKDWRIGSGLTLTGGALSFTTNFIFFGYLFIFSVGLFSLLVLFYTLLLFANMDKLVESEIT